MASYRRSWRIVVAAGLLATTSLVAAGAVGTGGALGATGAGAAASVKTNGVWPGVGKICGSGSGGDTPTTRGVSDKSIDIAEFNDAANTIEPGLEIEFLQVAGAFADWCNASGGIDGRKVVVQNRDGALFNAAEVTTQACASDFMAVGGGLVLDSSSYSIRVGCKLGQISTYTVSDDSVDSAYQVNPVGTNNNILSAGFLRVLAKEYPSAVKKAGFGAQNTPSVVEPETKDEIAAETFGWKVINFQLPPISVDDWTPYVQESQTKGVEALWPSSDDNIAPYVQAMDTAGYKPTFMILGTQFYVKATTKAAQSTPFPTTYVETQYWPLEMASQNASTAQLLAIMKKYEPSDSVDFNDEAAITSWLLWAKSATTCGSHLTVSCVLSNAASTKNWDAGGIQAPNKQLAMSDDNPTPTPCFAMLRVEPGKFVYDKSVTEPTQSIWNCDSANNVHFTSSQLAKINAAT